MRSPALEHPSAVVYLGDCVEVLAEMAENSVDAAVCDPPYGLEFMGKEWDQFKDTAARDMDTGEREAPWAQHAVPLDRRRAVNYQTWCLTWATEALRVLKPGGHLLAFGGTRTQHRLACAIEDAGFEIRDSIAWLYGSGFPKSLDVSKAIDRAAGAEREKGAETQYAGRNGRPIRPNGHDLGLLNDDGWAPNLDRMSTAPATPEAAQWEGWGTAMKPAHEPIVVARKPLAGSVAANVVAWGTGGLNVDACRVEMSDLDREVVDKRSGADDGTRHGIWSDGAGARRATGETFTSAPAGRWPPNVVLDESQAALLDAESGVTTSGAMSPLVRADHSNPMFPIGKDLTYSTEGDTGGASRFFPTFRYEAKAPTLERPRDGTTSHPTVKPVDLMRWLVRLVTPPGGTVLDPFAGSGATLEAAIDEGFQAIGIEREATYLPLIQTRLDRLVPRLFGVSELADDGPKKGRGRRPREDLSRKPSVVGDTSAPFGKGVAMGGKGSDLGRWPPNVVLGSSQASLLDEMSGEVRTFASQRDLKLTEGSDGTTTYAVGVGRVEPGERVGYGDAGGPSLFFPVFDDSPDEEDEAS